MSKPILTFAPLAFGVAISAVIGLAWMQRDEGHLTAESGIGYWLGIAGATLMLLLILYPLRKRLKFFHRFGRVANWFRMHMILGILAPTLVVLHTNFKLGSLNSRLALFTMLVVVASGIVGRYLYAKVHKGLYGKQAQLRDVLADITDLQAGLIEGLGQDRGLISELEAFAQKPAQTVNFWTVFFNAVTIGMRTRRARSRLLNRVRRHLSETQSSATRRQHRQHTRDIDQHLRLFFAAVNKAERLTLFERLFAMWHHLHMPLFALLAITVTVHIIAVHLY